MVDRRDSKWLGFMRLEGSVQPPREEKLNAEGKEQDENGIDLVWPTFQRSEKTEKGTAWDKPKYPCEWKFLRDKSDYARNNGERAACIYR